MSKINRVNERLMLASSTDRDDPKPDCSYCQAPCCTLLVVLEPSEIGRFESEPYEFKAGTRTILARREDGYCVYWDGGCVRYHDRPRVCVEYTCSRDDRITISSKYRLPVV